MLKIEKKFINSIVAVAGVVMLLGLSYGSYSYYRKSLSEKAHTAFMVDHNAFEKLSAEKVSLPQDALQNLVTQVSQNYQQYKNSAYAGFFLALQAELESLQGNKEQALLAMDNAIGTLSSVDPVLYYTYAIKHSLMQLDSAEPTIQTKGRQSLERLALNIKNPVRDMAWFYLGYQALLDNDNLGVQGAWGRLFDNQKNPTSLWGVRAQNILNYAA